MTVAYLLLVAVPSLLGIYTLGSTLAGLLRVRELRKVDCAGREGWPRLNIVTPACNEERHVRSAVESMLALDYPDFSVIAVDDRSTDTTGAVLDALAAKSPRLTVHHVTELPAGWLGKLNALAEGARRCDGEWLLFMDADAHLGKDTLKKAIAHADLMGIDCLSVIPEVQPAGPIGDAVFDVSLALLSAGGRLQKVADPRSEKVAATGAFILVRKRAFDRTPGFDWLRLEVADDFGLALLIKSHGGKADIVNGRGEVTLEWYASFAEMTRAMQKNFFAIMARFSLLRSIALALFSTWFALFGLALLLPAQPALHALTAAGLASITIATLLAARCAGRRLWPALLWPLGFAGMGWMSLRAGVIGWRVGGIQWRGVLYPSALLAPHQRVRP